MDSVIKYCGCCKTHKEATAFAKNRAKKDGLQERCRDCRGLHHQKVKHLRPKQTREQKRMYLLNSYGINQETFDQMLEEQQFGCAICGTGEWGRPSPSIDHCHDTGRVRGLLCNNCNRALGLFKDNLEVLKNATRYIERFSEPPTSL